MPTIESLTSREIHVLWAGASAGLLAAIALLTLPYLDEQWAPRPWFQAAYLTGVVLLEGLIALVLCLHVIASARAVSLAWLAGGYAFTSLTAAAQFLTFPEILNPADDSQAPVWLWVSWHSGFPCFVLMAMLTRRLASSTPTLPMPSPRVRVLWPIIAGVGLAIVCAAVIIRYSRDLPVLIVDGNYQRLQESPISAILLSLTVIALAATVAVTRLREMLHLWLALALFALTLDETLSLAGTYRYSAGWYMGRVLSLASAGALIVALLIEHVTLYRDAQLRALFHEQEARRDPLTGLFNRRHLEREANQELARAQRYRHPVTLLVLDIDHFKQVNDEHGHSVGDHCLRAIAAVLVERVHRPGDFAARYGGEEFIVLLPETGLRAGVDFAEQLRRRIEALNGSRADLPRITVSIGVASTGPDTVSPLKDLIERADRCLYEAKRRGRNRVAHYEASSAICVVEAQAA